MCLLQAHGTLHDLRWQTGQASGPGNAGKSCREDPAPKCWRRSHMKSLRALILADAKTSETLRIAIKWRSDRSFIVGLSATTRVGWRVILPTSRYLIASFAFYHYIGLSIWFWIWFHEHEEKQQGRQWGDCILRWMYSPSQMAMCWEEEQFKGIREWSSCQTWLVNNSCMPGVEISGGWVLNRGW